MKIVVTIVSLLAFSSLGCDGSGARCAHVATPISVEGPRPLTVRTDAGSLWTSAHVVAETQRAWTLPASGQVSDVEIHVLPGGGHSVTFRQAGVVWRGELDAERTARGPLQALPQPMAPDGGRVARSAE